MGIQDPTPFDMVEVSFKNGARKDFFKNPPHTRATTGDWVLVESSTGGYDIGVISLSGELVRLQMKRKRVRPDSRQQSVIRKAHERDMERLDQLRKSERDVMIRARVIARSLDLRMKIGDVEFQGDGRKCTFYYTADGRVDFRELIRHYAREFNIRVEMRQIGARQESARLGGLGNCGRELCCSTWLAEFKSVNTAAARYQNLAINQTKLSGMCGRLKCCLNYELDTYIDALEDFPDKAERLKTQAGLAILLKTDVFRRLMYYTYADDRSKLFALHVDQVWEALDRIKNGELPPSLEELLALAPPPPPDDGEEDDEPEHDYENVGNVLELPIEKRKKKRKKKRNKRAGQSLASALEQADQPPTTPLAQQQPSPLEIPKPTSPPSTAPPAGSSAPNNGERKKKKKKNRPKPNRPKGPNGGPPPTA